MPRIRTIAAAYMELKSLDPHTSVTLNGLRTMVLKGAVPSIRVGNKYLLDMEVLEAYLKGRFT